MNWDKPSLSVNDVTGLQMQPLKDAEPEWRHSDSVCVAPLWPCGATTDALEGPLSQQALAHSRLAGLVPVDGRRGSAGRFEFERRRDGCKGERRRETEDDVKHCDAGALSRAELSGRRLLLLSPRSFTMTASDCRGISLLFRGALVALGSRIIPEGAQPTHSKHC